MNYIGSKNKLTPFLLEVINNVYSNNLSGKIFCDIFAGTGIVGRSVKKSVAKVISNDIEYYSYVLNRNYIGNHLQIANLDSYIEELNQESPIENGFIFSNYCIGGGNERLYFSDENGKKIDAIRCKIELWRKIKYIDDDVYYFLLCSLLESADKFANTASVYGAFLKKLKKSALKDFVLQPAYYEINSNAHEVYNQDANSIINHIEGDILYIDPPYNSRQYGANYHLLNTIAEYKKFSPKGKTGLRDYKKSKYCAKNDVHKEFENLVRNAKFKHIFLSYNNEGLMTEAEIKSIMLKYGHYDVTMKEYQRFKADKNENRIHTANSTIEYLHILEKY